jgi:hypothetical protein
MLIINQKLKAIQKLHQQLALNKEEEDVGNLNRKGSTNNFNNSMLNKTQVNIQLANQ